MAALAKNLKWFKMRCTICRTEFYNLKSRKKLKEFIIVRVELFLNENTKKPQI